VTERTFKKLTGPALVAFEQICVGSFDLEHVDAGVLSQLLQGGYVRASYVADEFVPVVSPDLHRQWCKWASTIREGGDRDTIPNRPEKNMPTETVVDREHESSQAAPSANGVSARSRSHKDTDWEAQYDLAKAKMQEEFAEAHQTMVRLAVKLGIDVQIKFPEGGEAERVLSTAKPQLTPIETDAPVASSEPKPRKRGAAKAKASAVASEAKDGDARTGLRAGGLTAKTVAWVKKNPNHKTGEIASALGVPTAKMATILNGQKNKKNIEQNGERGSYTWS
jgi:hypothetical protein